GTQKGLMLAAYGVSIFFALSGFLITYLLQEEKDKGDINVRKFYLRRILRIWPLYYLYLLISLGFIFIFGLGFNIQSFFYYLFYAANVPFILSATLPFLAHYWSLGVEEQFYLFWPWVNKITSRRIGLVIFILIVIFMGIKLSVHFLFPNPLIEKALEITRFHCMMIGGLGAVLYKQRNALFLKIVDNKIAQAVCWAMITLVAVGRFHFVTVIDTEIISSVAVCIIIGQIGVKNRLINLEVKALDFLGKISYGIYVIHPLLIFLFAKAVVNIQLPAGPKLIFVYLSIITITIFIAHLSYKYFEKYFLNIKKKFVVVQSSPTKYFDPVSPAEVLKK
ncbi:MAG TPA: acyltransferase, partial [Chitinophagaceae bacterium]|nr:acyltransferase [Chitinophagaceae bacterium]